MKYVPTRKAVEVTGLCGKTLRKYADEGKIGCIRLPHSYRLFDVSMFVGDDKPADDGDQGLPVVCYCRVSSSKQRDDLTRQVAFMQKQFPDAEIIKDVGSGLNFKRKGLETILRRLMCGDKFTLVVAHRDRLCRFGFDLFKTLFEWNGGEIMVLGDKDASPFDELTQDLLSVLHVFSCRMHGLRRYTDQIEKDKDLSDTGTENAVQTVVRCGEEDVQ